jgi:hypothetical protein
MEFTKREQKILSPRHERTEKWTLWIGVISLCLSLALIPYAIYRINKLEKTWEFAHTYLKNEINTQTKKEIALKSMLLKNIKDEKELWVAYNTEKSITLVFVFFSVGCFLIVIYFKSRTYIKLIRKLQNS